MEFYYKKTVEGSVSSSGSNLIREFVKKSKIREITYIPHALAINGHVQAFIYVWIELFMVKIRKPLKYEREIIKLSDGGTIALDWYIDESGGIPIKAQEYQKQCRKPILACVSGLSGGNNNLYLYSTIKEAS